MTITLDSNTPSDVEWRGLVPSEHAFDVMETPQISSSGGTTEDVAEGDATFRDYTGATVTTDYLLQATGTEAHDVSYESLDPDKATIDSDGQTTRVAGGLTRILIRTPYYQTRSDVNVSQTVGSDSREFLNYNTGSIAKAMQDFVDDAVAGTVFGSASLPERLFNSFGDQYNQNCWAIAAGVKVYPSSFYSTYWQSNAGACLVHPRFAVVANHAHGSNGTTYIWKGSDNQNHSATIVNYTPIAGDLGLIELDSDAPATVGFARVLPDDWRDYFTSLQGPLTTSQNYTQSLIGIPCYRRNKNSRATIENWTGHLSDEPEQITAVFFSSNPERDQYSIALAIGDSSTQPCLIHPVDKYLIVLTVHGPTAVHAYKTEIETAMQLVVPGAQLTDADFSGFEL
jgi:hypothetical protein